MDISNLIKEFEAIAESCSTIVYEFQTAFMNNEQKTILDNSKSNGEMSLSKIKQKSYHQPSMSHSFKVELKRKGGKTMKGSVCYRKSDDRYVGRFSDSGKVICVYAKTKKECTEMLKEKMVVVSKGEPLCGKMMPLNTWADYWFENYQKPKLKISTYKSKRALYDSYVLAKFGKNPLNKIGVDELRNFIKGLPSMASKKLVYQLLKAMYAVAYDFGYIPKNYMSMVVIKLDPYPQKEKKALTHEEERTLFEEILPNTRYYNIACLMRWQALRIGEALGLRWEDVDFKDNVITIANAYNMVTKSMLTPKTDNSMATIPMFESTRELLLSMGVKSRGLIFGFEDPTYFARNFGRFCQRKGLDISAHTLRHTFASRAYEAGVDPKQVQMIMRHKKYDTTINVYTHLSKEKEQEAISKINHMFDTKSDTELTRI